MPSGARGGRHQRYLGNGSVIVFDLWVFRVHWVCAVRCVNCLSQQARICRPHGYQWLVAPLVLPCKCARCITSWYELTLSAVLAYLVDG